MLDALTGLEPYQILLPIAIIAYLLHLRWLRQDKEREAERERKLLERFPSPQSEEVQELRAFMNKGHSWSLGEVGRCAPIPDGSNLIELNDGTYRISEPRRLSGIGFSGVGGGVMKVTLEKGKGDA